MRKIIIKKEIQKETGKICFNFTNSTVELTKVVSNLKQTVISCN